MEKIREFSHRYLVCIDSDGCAFDSMESKHKLCFGPQVLRIWHLEGKEKQVLDKWNEVNLYSPTRAVNRFKGLLLVLKAFDIPDWRVIDEWSRRAPAMSNPELEKETDPALRRALDWSLAVNDAIAKMPTAKPFENVKSAIEGMMGKADIVVVSSTNPAALHTEWEKEGLLPYVSVILSHRDGSKTACIKSLLKQRYKPDQVIMLGDAPGDYQAAKENGIFFFPIFPGKEADSWLRFEKDVFPLFVNGLYGRKEEEIDTKGFQELFLRKMF